MRNFLHSILLLLFTLHVQSAPVLWSLYYANADTIAAAYCVNPSNPKCHGRCHIAKVTKQQQSNTQGQSENPPERPMPFIMTPAAEQPITENRPHTYTASTERVVRGFSSGIDHPPQFPIQG